MLEQLAPVINASTQSDHIKSFMITGNLKRNSTDSFTLNIDLKLKNGHSTGAIYLGKSTSGTFMPSNWNVAEKTITNKINTIFWSVDIPFDQVDMVWGVKVVLDENTDEELTLIRKLYFAKSKVFSPETGSVLFPEKELPQYKDRLDTGVCFSGGGTRSLLLSMGQMKYLQEQGYWKKAGYYTSVSGGSWASTIYSFSPEKDPTNLLGPIVSPADYVNQIKGKGVPDMGTGAKPKVFGFLLVVNLLRAAYPYLTNLDEIKDELEKYDFIKNIDDLLSPIIEIPANRIWIDSVGMCYFHPNNLYKILSPGKETYTLDQENVNEILSSGGSITQLFGNSGANIHTVTQRDNDETYPPYYIANGLMLRPTGSYTWNNPSYVGYEFTPLYGSPAFDGKWPQRFAYGPQIGGGNALSYTFGQEMIGQIPGVVDKEETTLLTMFQNDGYLPSLSVASGISSSAFAGATSYLSGLFPWKDVLQYFIDYFFSAEANSNEPMFSTEHLEGELKDKKADMDQLVSLLEQNKESCSSILRLLFKVIVEGGGELIDGMTPKSNYFSPVDQSRIPGNTLFNFGDGGLSDNFGLISLLRRGVKQIVVFINTSDPFEVITDSDKEQVKIDVTVPAFFGIVDEKPNPIGGQHFDDMKVFNTDEYTKQLLPQFKTAFQSKAAVVAETELEVLPNKAWDLEGGYTVNVLWYYNSLPEEFSKEAGEEVMRTLIPNKEDEGKEGAFPLYGTLSSTLGGLKPFEINMMGNIGYWILQNTDDKLKKFFT